MECNNCASCSSFCKCKKTIIIENETSIATGGLPLSMASSKESGTVVRISGDQETRKYLTDLGFILGSKVSVIKKVSGNMIIDVKGSRIAIGANIASRIHILPE